MKVMIAEDDANTRAGLAEVLSAEGYAVVLASNGDEAIRLFREQAPDAVCLDIMMPGTSGYDVCRQIRKSDPDVPVLFISAKSEEIDKVVGLELGADDFIVKPFGVKEVFARIRAITRAAWLRALPRPRQVLPHRRSRYIPSELRARRGDTVIELSLRDVKCWRCCSSQGAGNPRMFFNKCWGLEHTPNSRTLDQHIAQLRKRIEWIRASRRSSSRCTAQATDTTAEQSTASQQVRNAIPEPLRPGRPLRLSWSRRRQRAHARKGPPCLPRRGQ